MQTLIAVDVGTTGAKVALVNQDGAVLATAYRDYPTLSRPGNGVEQDPEAWWRAVCHALQEVVQGGLHQEVAGIMLSGQMQDLILLGPEGALGHAILYSDQRAQVEADELEAQVGAETLIQVTGNAQGAASLLAKWRWLCRHEPDRVRACRYLLPGAHDYIAWRLCGVAATDYTTAATTGLLALAANQWATPLLEAVQLPAALLPPLRPAGSRLGLLHQAASQATGLPEGIPVLQGVGDLGAATVGAGAGRPGRAYAYLGTSGWVACSATQAQPDPGRGLFLLRHADPRGFIQVAPMLTAGGNLAWLRGVLSSEALLDYDQVVRLAEAAPPGCRGLLYLPYLAGERSPFQDPNARACFLGISQGTGRPELARAVLEGTALAYRALCDVLALPAGAPLSLVGGGAQSPLWCQILADVLDRPVHVLADAASVPARGAALIAGRSLGWYADLFPGEAFFPTVRTHRPEAAHRSLYDHLYGLFQRLYPNLAETFAGLARLPQVAPSGPA